jgi:hypothetical protein
MAGLEGRCAPRRTHGPQAARPELRAIRNGHHSFRKLLQPGTDDQAVLTAHTGHIAEPIMDLPMLYLLHVMLNPQHILPKGLRDRA